MSDDYRRGPPQNSYGRYFQDRNAPTRQRYGPASGSKRRSDWLEDTYDPQIPEKKGKGDEKIDGSTKKSTLLSFKQFLITQDDSISDEDAINRYNDYKLEFRKQELNEFFVAHKDEEWFSDKYHPERSKERKNRQLANVAKRLEIFEWLRGRGFVDRARFDANNQTNMHKIMDAFIVKLEEGSDEDVDEFMRLIDNPELEHPPPVVNGDAKVNETDLALDDEDPNRIDNGDITDNPVVNGHRYSVRDQYRTKSIFLRNVAANVNKSDIEELCKNIPGFLRVGLSAANPERNYQRRAWITFKNDVNIKEICWNLGAIKIKDCDFGPIVNRDVVKRVRHANGLTQHRSVAQNDLRLASTLCRIFDSRANLYQEDSENDMRNLLLDLPPGTEFELGVRSNNPLLENIEDYLVEEASGFEDELLGIQNQSERVIAIERHEATLKTLDRILIYLRLVHSIDFYNYALYPNENDMPNILGLLHVRGPLPSVKDKGYSEDRNTKKLMVSQHIVDSFQKLHDDKLKPLIELDSRLSDDDIKKLGKKTEDKEVENFIAANTVELSKEKWLCPLSGKKFKGPEFIKKHIFGKFMRQIEQVKNDVEYFNNYLRDPKRPQPHQPTDAELKKPPEPLMSKEVPPPYHRPAGVDRERPITMRSFGFLSQPRPVPSALPPRAPTPPRSTTTGGSHNDSTSSQRELISYGDLDASIDVI